MAVADEIARIITTTLDIGAAYDDFFTVVKKLVGFEGAGVMIVSEDNQLVTPTYYTEPVRSPFDVGQAYELGGTLMGQVIENRRAATIPDLTEEHAFRSIDRLAQVGISSLVLTPLIFEDRVIGGFIFFSDKRNAFGERELTIIERLSSQAAPSLRNAGLYQEADRFGLALDSIGKSVAFLDLDLKFRYVNRAFEETYGYNSNEIRGQEIWILASNLYSDDDQTRDILKQSVAGGWSGEVVTTAKSGETFNMLLTVAPVKDKSGQVIGLISVSRNITESKRTAARLTEQNRLASIGELAAGVAHEMNNPLTSILLCSQ